MMEIAPLIERIRTDGWRSYQTVANELGEIYYRVVLRDPKDTMRLLPWTHQAIANAKSVFMGPHRGVSEKHLQRTFLKYATDSIGDSGINKPIIDC